MADGTYYVNSTNRVLDPENGGSGPMLSHALESTRAYQWEVEIETNVGGSDDVLTLACKQITQAGFESENIVVDRVNDKFHYPGKVTPEAVTFTFDNLNKSDYDLAERLYAWMSTTYDSVNGVFTPAIIDGTGTFKSKINIYYLDNHMQPQKWVQLFGAYPKSWKLAEFNYATNEFHTIEVQVMYDFIVQYPTLSS
jgi:hypothetical protein